MGRETRRKSARQGRNTELRQGATRQRKGGAASVAHAAQCPAKCGSISVRGPLCGDVVPLQASTSRTDAFCALSQSVLSASAAR